MVEFCYSIVKKPRNFEVSNEMALRKGIMGDNIEMCQRSIEELLQSVLDGDKFPTNLMMPVINRYQMTRFSGDVGNKDKRIKKLLYILWESLPKRGPDGKFLDKMVMVCGAFDKDLKHPNQYVCGTVLRTLSKTREPEVIRELVHSIEKCLDWSHAYQRKNAILTIASIYKNFPDLNTTAPKMIAEHLMKENDDECKRAALQALLEIDPEEARPYLHSSNIQDIHCMNTSIQLLFVELIQRVYKKGSDEAADYLSILTGLIRLSSSPSVRYQAAYTLMKFSRNAEEIKLVANCFIDICAKESDNNVKLIALDSLTKLRRLNGAERIIRNSVMDILFIIQSASDPTLQGKILTLTLDLLSPLNVGEVVNALRQEIEKNATDQDKTIYLRFLVSAMHNIAERYPNAIIEHEMLDTLFKLLTNNTAGDKISTDLLLFFKVFLTKNPTYQGKVLERLQDSFSQTLSNPIVYKALIQLLGEFSETQVQIERSYEVIKESMKEIKDCSAVLCYAILKMACRHRGHKMIAQFMWFVASILNLHGYDENLILALRILQSTDAEAGLMRKILDDIRGQLSQVSVQSKKETKTTKFDDAIQIPLFASRDDELVFNTPTIEDSDPSRLSVPDMFGQLPLTGTIDPIYAYCEFDINQYDICLNVHVENRTPSTLENVSLQLAARGDNPTNFIDRPEPVVLAPRASACIKSTIKIISAENRRLFGSIAFEDTARTGSDDKELVLMLNDIRVNITDYIKPAKKSFDEFREIWRDCEWENKVVVKTKSTNLREYLMQLIAATNMQCITTEKSLDGDCSFLLANLYAKSSFGEEALVNLSIEKESPNSIVTGSVKIRSRSQAMALSLGEKITSAQKV